MRWKGDDYDVREGTSDGPVVGRIYKTVHSPSGAPWFWAVQLLPAVAADTGSLQGAVDSAARLGASMGPAAVNFI